MPAPSVTALPTAPQRTMTPEAFIDASDPWAAALGPWGEQVEAVGDYVEETAAAVTSSAAAAATSATSSASSATASAESATSAASSATTATTKASEAATSATAAETARAASVVAKTAAETAQAAAEAARDEAEAIVGDGYVLKPGGTGNTGKVAVFSDTDGRNVTGLAIGAAASTDIIDRQTGDARYALSGSGASSRDLARHALAIAELRGTRLPGSAGWSDSFGDTTGVDAAASSNEIYDAVVDLYSNSAPAGEVWVKDTAGSTDIGNDNLNGLATNGSFYITVGENGRILKSTGMSVSDWTVKVSGLGALKHVIYSTRLALFIVVGFNAAGNAGLIYTSPDGETWTAQTSGVATQLNGLCETATHVVVVGASGVILTSTNATSWTSQTSGTTDDLRSVVHGDGITIAASFTAGRVYRSTNLTSWTSVNLPDTGMPAALFAGNLVFNGEYFLTLYSGGSTAYWRKSTDGLTWTEGAVALGMSSVYSLFWTGVRWVLSSSSIPSGSGSGGCATSNDGETWVSANTVGVYAKAYVIVGGVIVSAGQIGYISTSTPPLAAMDLRSVVGSLATVPSKANLVVIAKGSSAITPGTHLTGYVSRNDGTNWQDMSLAAAETDSAGWTVFEAYGVDLSAQPSGDDLRWRVTTTDDFAVEVAGVFVGVEV